MTKKKLPVRFTGQHFTIDKVLIKDAIRQANISNQDTVLDIGAGKGFLTVHLLKIANNVVAIENDTALVEHLRKNTGILHLLFFLREKYLTKPAL